LLNEATKEEPKAKKAKVKAKKEKKEKPVKEEEKTPVVTSNAGALS
jgi:hypothetical protein